MAGEDQERFEDYLELESYIEELQAGRPAHPPIDLTPNQVRIYRMAALFRSVSLEANEPRPEFVEDLRARLLALEAEETEDITVKRPAIKKALVPNQPVTGDEPQASETEHDNQQIPGQEKPEERVAKEVQPAAIPLKKGVAKKASFVSRRALLTGGAVAAASLVVGTAARKVSPEPQAQTAPPVASASVDPHITYDNSPLLQKGVPTKWHFVTTVAQLGNNAVNFVTDTVIGYVIKNDGDGDPEDAAEKQSIIAVSAACTHRGCIVQWQNSDRCFHCPCHGGLFTEYGKPADSTRLYLEPLPRLNTKVLGDEIFVEVPLPVSTI